MLFAAGAIGAASAAAAGAVDLLSSLVSKAGAKKTGLTQNSSTPFSTAAMSPTSSSTQTLVSGKSSASGPLSPATFSALFSTQDTTQSGSSNPTDALKSLFAQLDGNSDGKITKAEFEDKLGAGGTNIAAADNVFNKMDTDGDGSVSLDEMASALKGKGGAHHAHHGGGGGGGGADALLNALQAASSTSTTNSDGSITTTMTYADGTTLTLSQPASSTASSNASSKYNLVEQMVQRQADSLATAAKQSVSVRV